MRAALYARVSTDKQVEKYGIPSQIEALKKDAGKGIGLQYLMGIREPLLTRALAELSWTGQLLIVCAK